jgi:hypothetical protein
MNRPIFCRHRLSILGAFFALVFPLVGAETSAQAGVVIVPPGEDVKIPIASKTGSLVQLPSSVKAVTPSQFFEIVDVASEVDSATGAKVDVKLFQVRQLPGAQPEIVSFVLGDGRTIKVQLIASENADKHYDLVFPTDARKLRHPKFLQAEISLMYAMVRDEGGLFARQTVDSSVSLTGLDKSSATLKRIFAGNGLTGYVFELRNKSSSVMQVDVSRIGFGTALSNGSRVALVHADKDRLEHCGLFASPECKTLLFVVARSEFPGAKKKSSIESASQQRQPFVHQDAEQNGGGR